MAIIRYIKERRQQNNLVIKEVQTILTHCLGSKCVSTMGFGNACNGYAWKYVYGVVLGGNVRLFSRLLLLKESIFRDRAAQRARRR